MNEAQILALISSLSVLIPQSVSLYNQITANRQGVKTIEELLADADQQYQANLDQLDKN